MTGERVGRAVIVGRRVRQVLGVIMLGSSVVEEMGRRSARCGERWERAGSAGERTSAKTPAICSKKYRCG